MGLMYRCGAASDTEAATLCDDHGSYAGHSTKRRRLTLDDEFDDWKDSIEDNNDDDKDDVTR